MNSVTIDWLRNFGNASHVKELLDEIEKLLAENASLKAELINMTLREPNRSRADYDLELAKNAVLTRTMLAVAGYLRGETQDEERDVQFAKMLEDARSTPVKL